MGYSSTLYGEWKINPPLNGRQLRALPVLDAVKIRVEETDRETDEGVLTIKTGAAVVPAFDYEVKLYRVEDELTGILRAIPDGTTVEGELIRVGEENGDIERYLPHPPLTSELRLHAERARLTWPDGTTVTY